MKKAKSIEGLIRISIPYAEYLMELEKYKEAQNVIYNALKLPKNDKSATMVLKNILRKAEVRLGKKPDLSGQIEKFFESQNEWPDAFYSYCISLECYSILKLKKEANLTLTKLSEIETDKINPTVLSKKMKLYSFLEYNRSFGTTSEFLKTQIELKNAEMEILKLDRSSLKKRVSVSELGDESFAKMILQEEELMRQNQNLKSRNRLVMILAILFIVITTISYFFYRLYRKQKMTSKRNEILVLEQNHRVKNNLQTISSLLSMQKDNSINSEFEKLVDESKMRIDAMASVQRSLSSTNLGGISVGYLLKEIVENIFIGFGKLQIPVEFDLDQIILDPTKCTPLAILVNEITTNSCKYGLNHSNSKFICTLKNYNSHFELIIGDNGNGFKINNNQNSLGLQLIELQSEQLFGKIKLSKSLYTLSIPYDKSINNRG